MKCLVTGATGFVGGVLVQRLLADGHTVRVLRRTAASERGQIPQGPVPKSALSSRVHSSSDIAFGDRSRWDLSPSSVPTSHLTKSALIGDRPPWGLSPVSESIETHVGDITDAAAVDRAVVGCDVVFHSAALIQYWDDRNAEQTAVNVDGTRHVVDACVRHGVQRLIHISSIAAIGATPEGTLLDERSAYNLAPYRVNYSDTKYAAEQLVHAAAARGLGAVIVNPGTIFGPGDRRRVGYIRGLAGPISSGGGMAVVDVRDVVDGAIRAWQHGRRGERYILIAENLPYRTVGRALAQLLGRRGPWCTVPAPLIRAGAAIIAPIGRALGARFSLTPAMARLAHLRFFFDNRKSRDELGLTYLPVADTLRDTIGWLQTHHLI